MKRRILIVLLTALAMIGAMSAMSFAADLLFDDKLYIGDEIVIEDMTQDASGTYHDSVCTGGSYEYKASTHTLTLTNVNIKGLYPAYFLMTMPSGIYYDASDNSSPLTIKLVGKNTITALDDECSVGIATLSKNTKIIITGSENSSLTIKAKAAGIEVVDFFNESASLELQDANVSLESVNTGIICDNLSVKGNSVLRIDATNPATGEEIYAFGIETTKKLDINLGQAGEVIVNTSAEDMAYAIYSYGGININTNDGIKIITPANGKVFSVTDDSNTFYSIGTDGKTPASSVDIKYVASGVKTADTTETILYALMAMLVVAGVAVVGLKGRAN